MAHPQPNTDHKHFDNVVLSGNNSDASYDMADDESSQASETKKNSVAKSTFESFEIDTNRKDKGKGKAILEGTSYHNLPEAHRAKAGQDDAKEEKHQEQYYDLYPDQHVGKIRQKFRLTGQLMINLLDSLVSLEPADRQNIYALLQEHARTIAFMFGDDIPKLKQSLQSALDGMTGVCKESNRVWNEIKTIRLELEAETQARRGIEDHQKLTMESLSKMNTKYLNEAQLRKELQAKHEDAVQAASVLKEELSKETNRKNVHYQQGLRSERANHDLKEEVARNLALIAAQRVQIHSQKDELVAAKCSTRKVEDEMRLQQSSHRQAAKLLNEERTELAAENKQLDNTRKSLIEELNTIRARSNNANKELSTIKARYCDAIEELNIMQSSYNDAIKAVKAEREAKEAAIPKKLKLEAENVQLKLRLQEIETQSTMILANERELREKTLEEKAEIEKNCALLKRSVYDLSHRNAELVDARRRRATMDRKRFALEAEGRENGTDKETKEYKQASTNTSCEHTAEESDREHEMEKLRKELTMSENKKEVLHNLVKRMVASDVKKAEYIVKINKELTEANNELTMLGSSKNDGEQEEINKLLDEKRESKKSLKYISYQLDQSRESGSCLRKEKMDLTTRVGILEENLAEAKTNSQKVRGTITALVQVLKPIELEFFTKPFEVARGRDSVGHVLQCKALNDIAEAISVFLSKQLPSINVQASEKHATAEPDAQELLNLKERLLSATTELQKLAQVNLQLLASRDAASRELIERREQIAELEAMQSKLQFNGSRATAQFNQMRTSYRCLEDLHHSDLERIKKLEQELKALSPRPLLDLEE
ncbi:hypothetical protein VTL71DRAFT_14408 [Oculimacula yallundae]|uniref:Uncharacterized protein n=1 Tax=Oculimacula yallundae TaxID=86028 RepID=A0ABR4CIE2_9HELO